MSDKVLIKYFEVKRIGQSHKPYFARTATNDSLDLDGALASLGKNTCPLGSVTEPTNWGVPPATTNALGNLTITVDEPFDTVFIAVKCEATGTLFPELDPSSAPSVTVNGEAGFIECYNNPAEDKWAVFKIDTGRYRQAANPSHHAQEGVFHGHRLARLPVFLNFFDTHYGSSSIAIDPQTNLIQDQSSLDRGEDINHGGIHPPTAASFVVIE